LFFKTATYSGNLNLISLNFNSNGRISLQLPQGPQSDSYKIYLSVNVIDDTNGITNYYVKNNPIIVIPDDALAQSLRQSMRANDQNNQFIAGLNSGNLNLIAANVIAMSSVYNAESEALINTSITNTSKNNDNNNEKAAMRDYMAQKMTQMSVYDVSSIKVMGSALSKLTEIPEQVSSNTAVIIKNIVFIYYFNILMRNIFLTK
jgi:hypothetical protein